VPDTWQSPPLPSRRAPSKDVPRGPASAVPRGVIPIAILPFSTEAGDPLLADMITDDLGHTLSRVAALRVPGGNAMPRSQIDEYTAFVGRYGAKGLAYIKVNERAKGRDGLQSPVVKFLNEAAVAGILERTGAQRTFRINLLLLFRDYEDPRLRETTGELLEKKNSVAIAKKRLN